MAYPDELNAAKALVEEHIQGIPDEKLQFAAYYSPNGADPYILEVTENFGYDDIGYEGDLMDTQFKPFGTFAETTDRPIHLVLTNPKEYDFAIANNWPSIRLLRQALEDGRFKPLIENSLLESKLITVRT